VAAEIDGMRRALGAASLRRIPPHITLVPPVNVAAGEGEAVYELLRSCAAASGPISVELGGPATFFPRTPVVYLAVGGDVAEIERLAGCLASGPLAPPPGRRERSFVPHVTIDQRAEPELIPPALLVLDSYRQQFVFEEVTLLEQDPEHVWHPVSAAPLGAPAVVARGALELALSASDGLDPAEARWAESMWRAAVETPANEGRPFAVTARREGALAGVAGGYLSSGVCQLERLVVDPQLRRQGIGSQLLRAVADLALDAGCSVARALVPAGAGEGLLLARGFSVVARVPGPPESLVFERRLPPVARID
jgi:2'-5' RNA ligase/N-acetylglutamate synthase-like GNAT family acetyltransferase